MLGGVYLKKLRRVEGGAKIYGVFRVKNHDFTPTKSYFFQGTHPARALPLNGKKYDFLQLKGHLISMHKKSLKIPKG
jgi:hypothetical protein